MCVGEYWPLRNKCVIIQLILFFQGALLAEGLNWQQGQQKQRRQHRWLRFTQSLNSPRAQMKRGFVYGATSGCRQKDTGVWLKGTKAEGRWQRAKFNSYRFEPPVTFFFSKAAHFIPAPVLPPTWIDLCLFCFFVGAVINSVLSPTEVGLLQKDFSRLDVICYDKPTEAILQLQMGRDNPSWCHIRGRKKAAGFIRAAMIAAAASSAAVCPPFLSV